MLVKIMRAYTVMYGFWNLSNSVELQMDNTEQIIL